MKSRLATTMQHYQQHNIVAEQRGYTKSKGDYRYIKTRGCYIKARLLEAATLIVTVPSACC